MRILAKVLILFLVTGLWQAHAQESQEQKPKTGKEGKMAFVLKTVAFQEGEVIPVKYTCDGEDVSPPLVWENIPEGTRSFALICDDPDAPVGTWVHWVIYNIPPAVSSLPENVDKTRAVLDEPLKGVVQGVNSWNRIGYGGPCPPPGPAHRYYFKLYALDTVIKGERLNKTRLLKEMEGHVLAETQIMGRYQRK